MGAMEYKFDPANDIKKMINDFASIDANTEEALTIAADEGAKLIEAAQKRLAPVRTGKLKNSIERYKRTKKGSASVYIGIDFKKNPDLRGRAVANEFGRKEGRTKTGKKIYKMNAHPFIRPGFDSAEESAFKRATEVFWEKVGLKK